MLWSLLKVVNLFCCFSPSCWMDVWVAELEQLNKLIPNCVLPNLFIQKSSPAKDDAFFTQLLRQKLFRASWGQGWRNLQFIISFHCLPFNQLRCYNKIKSVIYKFCCIKPLINKKSSNFKKIFFSDIVYRFVRAG